MAGRRQGGAARGAACGSSGPPRRPAAAGQARRGGRAVDHAGRGAPVGRADRRAADHRAARQRAAGGRAGALRAGAARAGRRAGRRPRRRAAPPPPARAGRGRGAAPAAAGHHHVHRPGRAALGAGLGAGRLRPERAAVDRRGARARRRRQDDLGPALGAPRQRSLPGRARPSRPAGLRSRRADGARAGTGHRAAGGGCARGPDPARRGRAVGAAAHDTDGSSGAAVPGQRP